MSMITWLSPLICAGGLLSGPDPAQRTPSPAANPAIILAGHTQCDPCDPCEECGPCRKGLRRLFGGLKRDCCVASVECSDCSTCDLDCTDCCEKRGLLVKLGRLIFGRRTVCCECPPVCSAPVGTVMVEKQVAAATPVKPEVVYKPKPIAPAPTRVEPTTGHARDYSWVQGRLEYAHVNGGAWLVRYAGLAENDIYGGSVVLVRDARMADYREGDVVRVHGEIIHEKSSVFLACPLYRASDVTLVRSVADSMVR